MPYHLSWIKPGQLAFERLYGVVTIEEMQEMQSKFLAWSKEVNRPVHMIVDFTQVESFPKNIVQIRSALITDIDPSIQGWVVLVTNNVLLRFVSNLVTQHFMRDGRIRSVESFADAVAYLKQADPELSKLDMDLIAPAL